MGFLEVFVRRPVFTTMLITALVVLGAASFVQLGVDIFPKVDLPTVTITTSLPGAGPGPAESSPDVIEQRHLLDHRVRLQCGVVGGLLG